MHATNRLRQGQPWNSRFSSLFLGAAMIMLWLASCATPQPPVNGQGAAGGAAEGALQAVTAETPQPSATATLPPTATFTPSPTLTPTPTPTPTPTAVPMIVSSNPRDARLRAPVAQAGAACGIVDVLDFPMDPPDAENVTRGGQDFGVYRDRYDSYHAGEDWWVSRGSGNFGLPVYSIGHGTVTYAEPLGWGRDQGIVIVRHIFSDGSTFLSFYGHLDPPSITLEAGECVVRGQKVGEIGRPRTPPHLHFEIRTHLPTEPGGGYWDVDPTQAGWLPPSQTIWEQRNTTAPGIIWSWPITEEGSVPVGLIDAQTFLLIVDQELVAVDLIDGSLQWRLAVDFAVAQAMVDETQQRMYVVSRQGEVVAYRLAQGADATLQPDPTPLWQQNLAVVGMPTLISMPDGGLLVAVRQRLFGLAVDGRLVWEAELPSDLLDWVMADNQLILASSGRSGMLWTVTTDGPEAWLDSRNGRFLAQGNLLLLYANDGLYRLDVARQTAVPFYSLPPTFGGSNDVVPLADGGILVLHSDSYDRRLIVLNPDGGLRWERSVRRSVPGNMTLHAAGSKVYLVSFNDRVANHDLSLYAIEYAQPELTHLFTGGTRLRGYNDTWVQLVGENLLLLQIGGGNLLALDTRLAGASLLSE